MTLALDHSIAGAILGGTARKFGYSGLVRYSCGYRGPVNITPGEVADIKANGLELAIVLEHEADWLVRPNVAQRVRDCLAVSRACKVPDGLIWLACDFDATHWGPTAPGSLGDQTMHAVAAGIDQARTAWPHLGFYGSFFAIEWLIAHGYGWLAFWQTEAWSIMGRDRSQNRHPAASLFQRAQRVNIAGVSCDVNEVWKPDWGQRVIAQPAPAPQPKPQPDPKPAPLSRDQQITNRAFNWAWTENQRGPFHPLSAKEKQDVLWGVQKGLGL